MNTNEDKKETAISWTSGINFVAGIWLIASAWALSSEIRASQTNDWILGLIVLALSWFRLTVRSRAGAPSWLNTIAGLWLIIAPFALHYESATQKWNSIVVGIVISILALVSGATGATRPPPANA